MQISPKWHRAEDLLGMSREDAQNEINDIVREITRIQKELEMTSLNDHMMPYHIPTREGSLGMRRYELNVIREYFKLQRWEYEPTKIEIADQKFNDRLRYLQSIEIEFSGNTYGNEIRKITFDNEKIHVDRSFTINFPCPNETDRKFFDGMTKKKLLEKLTRLHIGGWKRKYKNSWNSNDSQWSVVFKYSDGKERKFEGFNRYPYDFDNFLKLIEMDWCFKRFKDLDIQYIE